MLSQLNLSVWLPGCTVDGPRMCTDNSMVWDARRVPKKCGWCSLPPKKDEGTACWSLLHIILFHHCLFVKQSFQPFWKDWQKPLDPTIQAPKKNCCRETIVLPTALLCSDHGSAILVHCDSLSGLSGSKTTLKQGIEVVSWRTYLRQESNSFLYFGWPLRFDQSSCRESPSPLAISANQKIFRSASKAFKPWRFGQVGPWWYSKTTVRSFDSSTTFQWKKQKKGGVSYVPQTTRSSWIYSWGDLSVDISLSCT